MTCYRQGSTIVCTRGPKAKTKGWAPGCRFCVYPAPWREATCVCDFVLRESGKPARTCDTPCCDGHAVDVGRGRHHCESHRHESSKLHM